MVPEMPTGASNVAFNGADKIRKICSKKWEKVLKGHVEYRRGVQQKVTLYQNSMNSRCTHCKTSLNLLQGKLKESESIVQKWNEKNSLLKRMTSQDFIEELDRSENTIAHHFQLFRHCTCQERNPAGTQKRPERKEVNQGKSQRSREKEREETRYKAWLRKNIKCTDLWPNYSERCTNSKLDRAEKKILFEEHVKGLREPFLKDYRQLLKEVITHQRAKQNIKCLKYWSDAESLLRGHQRFGRLPKEDREPEWRIHANQILKKMNQQ